jgi:hypothetical protein
MTSMSDNFADYLIGFDSSKSDHECHLRIRGQTGKLRKTKGLDEGGREGIVDARPHKADMFRAF